MKPLAAACLALAVSGCLRPLTPEEAARYQAFGAALSGAGAAMRPAPETTYRPPMTCLKSSEYVAGLSRVCAYNCGGSPYALTVGATDLCPLSLP